MDQNDEGCIGNERSGAPNTNANDQPGIASWAGSAAHPSSDGQTVRLRSSCDGCQEAKSRCSRETPCFRCKVHDIACIYSPTKRIGRPRLSSNKKASGDRGGSNNYQGKKPTQKQRKPSNGTIRQATVDTSTSLSESTAPSTSSGYTQDLPLTLSGFIEEDLGYFFSEMNDPVGNCKDDELSLLGPILPTPAESDQMNLEMGLEMNWGNRARDSAMHGATTSQNDAMAPDSHFQPATPIRPSSYTCLATQDVLMHGYQIEAQQTRVSTQQSVAREHISWPSATDPTSISGAIRRKTTCACSRSALRLLWDMEESCGRNTVEIAVTIDILSHPSVLRQVQQMMTCAQCCAEAPDIPLLVTIAASQYVSHIETIANARKSGISWSMSANRNSRSQAHGFSPILDIHPLLVGSIEISSEERNEFFQQLLRFRLQQLCSAMQQFQSCLAEGSDSLQLQLAATLAVSIVRRSHLLLGRLEVSSSTHTQQDPVMINSSATLSRSGSSGRLSGV
ncbi:hypothetical protein CERZMDRAFT_81862 [Cercospora zeae-maydis SCOH1-5]|uniref:Zn(2)-C6 fungal-type domain-containing protein n=1 Tax=Cercospora zeae-maydis SCOH1-5 TaxID=717836 RepID=A0A6A6FQK7_9PEZI|nr:hypothetical protein CERZMDRAFT_81862 [Cercospora zeae-maydis SCOH1-5]